MESEKGGGVWAEAWGRDVTRSHHLDMMMIHNRISRQERLGHSLPRNLQASLSGWRLSLPTWATQSPLWFVHYWACDSVSSQVGKPTHHRRPGSDAGSHFCWRKWIQKENDNLQGVTPTQLSLKWSQKALNLIGVVLHKLPFKGFLCHLSNYEILLQSD